VPWDNQALIASGLIGAQLRNQLVKRHLQPEQFFSSPDWTSDFVPDTF